VTASFRDPPRTAARRHRDARDGFEVAFVESGLVREYPGIGARAT
jgi:hypothetical protein